MNESNIKVISTDFITNLGLFQAEIDKMSELLQDIKTKTSQMNSYWKGNDSEEVSASMSKFSAQFESINEQNNKYTAFLSSTIEKYTALDKAIETTSDSSSGFRINGS